MTAFPLRQGGLLPGWPLIALALLLLACGIAAPAYQMLARDAVLEERRQGLETGLQEIWRAVALLRGGPEAASAAPALASLARLAAAEPALIPAQRSLALTATQLARAEEAAPLEAAGAALERAIRAELRQLRLERQGQRRAALLVGLAGLGGGVPLLLAGLLAARLQAVHQTEQVRHESARLSAVCQVVPIGLVLLDAEGRVLSANPRFAALAGQSEARLAGQPLDRAMPLLGALLLPLLRGVLEQGKALDGREMAVAGLGGGRQHYYVAAEPVRDAAGPGLARLSLVVMDVTEQAALESWRTDLVNELNHRVKNTLSTVQSLAAQTMRGAGQDPVRFAADFSARLGALSRSHELLASVGWSKATLEGAVQAALAPWKGIWQATGQLVVHGPTGLVLRPAQAQAMVIALSELASNASRHGALAHDGRVTLRWQATPNGLISLSWHEHGALRLAGPPPQRGFGLRFLERGLAHDLGPGAQVMLNFEPTGLRCDVSFRAGPPQAAPFSLAKGAA